MTPRHRETLARIACWLAFLIMAGIVLQPRQAHLIGWRTINTITAAIGRTLPRAPADTTTATANGAGLGPRNGTEAPPPAR